MFPFEFVIFDRPLSLQAEAVPRAEWKQVVRFLAEIHWAGRGAPTAEPVYFSVGNFHEPGIQQPDADNIIKPIQDALEGLVYTNDRQVVDSLGFKRTLSGPVRIDAALTRVWDALETDEEFVHIAVSLASARHYVGV